MNIMKYVKYKALFAREIIANYEGKCYNASMETFGFKLDERGTLAHSFKLSFVFCFAGWLVI